MWIHGGKPITATSTAAAGGVGLSEGSDRANLSGNPLYCSSSSTGTCKATSKSIDSAISNGTTYIQWFNPAAIVSPPALTYAATRVGQFYGPGYAAFDLSVFKNVGLAEGMRLQFRGEMFNIFNRYNYSNPTFSTNALTASTSQTTGQVTATAGGSSAPGIGAGEPFNVQLALKILF